MDALFLSLRQLSFAASFLVVFFGLGNLILRARPLRIPSDSFLIYAFFATVTGFAAAAIYVAFLSGFGILYRPLLLFLLIGILGLRGVFATTRELRFIFLIPLLLLPLLLMTLYPNVSGDDTSAHLPWTRWLLDQHRLIPAPHLRNPVFPLYGEMFLLLGMALEPGLTNSQINAQLMNWLALVLIAFGCFATLLRRHSERAAWAGFSVVLAHRIYLILGANGYIDIQLGLYSLAAVLALYFYVENGGATSLLLLCGVYSGIAIGIKYTGLIVAASIGLMLILQRRWRAAFIYSGVVLFIGGGFYVWIFAHTGNPVWPFLSKFFGYAPLWSSADYAAQFRDLSASSGPKGLRALLALPWRMAMAQEMGRGPLEIGPLLFVGFLALFFGRRALHKKEQPLLLVPLFYSVVWFLSFNHLRYFIPALGPFCILSGLGLGIFLQRLKKGRRIAFAAILLAGFLPGYISIAVELIGYRPLPGNAAMRDAFLSQRAPNYRATRIAATLPGMTYGLHDSDAMYFADGRMIGDVFGYARHPDIEALLERPRDLAAKLTELSTQNLLIYKPRLGRDVKLFAPFRRIYEDRTMALYRLEDSSYPTISR